jgi:hypothetical protein
MEKTTGERRAAKRVSYLCEVECLGAGASRMNTRINDLSTTGLFVDCMTSFPEGSILTIKFKLRDTEIKVSGEVRYCMPQIGMGIRFIDLQPEQRDLIEQVTGS